MPYFNWLPALNRFNYLLNWNFRTVTSFFDNRSVTLLTSSIKDFTLCVATGRAGAVGVGLIMNTSQRFDTSVSCILPIAITWSADRECRPFVQIAVLGVGGTERSSFDYISMRMVKVNRSLPFTRSFDRLSSFLQMYLYAWNVCRTSIVWPEVLIKFVGALLLGYVVFNLPPLHRWLSSIRIIHKSKLLTEYSLT